MGRDSIERLFGDALSQKPQLDVVEPEGLKESLRAREASLRY